MRNAVGEFEGFAGIHAVVVVKQFVEVVKATDDEHRKAVACVDDFKVEVLDEIVLEVEFGYLKQQVVLDVRKAIGLEGEEQNVRNVVIVKELHRGVGCFLGTIAALEGSAPHHTAHLRAELEFTTFAITLDHQAGEWRNVALGIGGSELFECLLETLAVAILYITECVEEEELWHKFREWPLLVYEVVVVVHEFGVACQIFLVGVDIERILTLGHFPERLDVIRVADSHAVRALGIGIHQFAAP